MSERERDPNCVHGVVCDEPAPYRIIIAERGWVYVGRAAREGDQLVISDCYNVRNWGTSRGLGELALEGPKDGKTILDYYGTVRIHVLALCGMIDCDEDVWTGASAKLMRKAAKGR